MTQVLSAKSTTPVPSTKLRVLVLDTERGAHHVSGLPNVKVVPVKDFKELELAFWDLYKSPAKLQEYDLLAIDTISALFNTTRHSIVLDPEKVGVGDLWAKRGVYASDSRPDYRVGNDLVARLLQMFRSLPIPTVYVAHEKDRLDPAGYKKRGPSVSPGLLDEVTAWSDVIANLGQTLRPVVLGKTTIPAGTRRLRLVPDNRYMAKFRQSPLLPQMAPVILEPTQHDLAEIMRHVSGKTPWITLYGPPGVGKTSLVVGATYQAQEASAVLEQETQDVPMTDGEEVKS